jgi:hypothetical protein
MALIVQIDTKVYQFFLLAFSIFVLVLSCFNFSYYSSIVSQYVAEPNKPQDVGSNWATAMKWINLTLIILSALMIIYSIYKLIIIFTEGEKNSDGEIVKGTKNETAKDMTAAGTAAGLSASVAGAAGAAGAAALTTATAAGEGKDAAAGAAGAAADDAARKVGATPAEARKAGEVAAEAARAAYDKTKKVLDAIGARYYNIKGNISGVWQAIYDKLKSLGASEEKAKKGADAAADAAPPAGPDGAPPAGAGLDAAIARMEAAAESASGMKIDWSGFSATLKSLRGKVGTAGERLYNATTAALMASGESSINAAKLAAAVLGAIESNKALPDWFIDLQTKYYIRRPEFFDQGYDVVQIKGEEGKFGLERKGPYNATALSPTLAASMIGGSINAANYVLDHLEADNLESKIGALRGEQEASRYDSSQWSKEYAKATGEFESAKTNLAEALSTYENALKTVNTNKTESVADMETAKRNLDFVSQEFKSRRSAYEDLGNKVKDLAKSARNADEKTKSAEQFIGEMAKRKNIESLRKLYRDNASDAAKIEKINQLLAGLGTDGDGAAPMLGGDE